MKYRMLDENKDYTFGLNLQNYVYDVHAVAQAIRTKILLFYGEWWENIGIGIPMFQSIIGQTNPETLQQSASLLITQRIEEVEGVRSIDEVQITNQNRVLDVRISVNTIYGPVTLEVAI